MTIHGTIGFTTKSVPVLLYFFDIFKHINSNARNMDNIEKFVFTRYNEYVMGTNNPYQLIVNDIIKNKEMFKPFGINIDCDSQERRYQIFKACEIVMVTIINFYLAVIYKQDIEIYNEKAIIQIADIILSRSPKRRRREKDIDLSSMFANIHTCLWVKQFHHERERLADFIHTGYRFYKVFEKHGFK